MTRLACPQGHELADGQTFCPAHNVFGVARPAPEDPVDGDDAPARTASAGAPDATQPVSEPSAGGAVATDGTESGNGPTAGDGTSSTAPEPTPAPEPHCPHCGEPVLDPRNTHCLRCQRSLQPADLTLRFDIGCQVSLCRGDSALLGRDPASRWHAHFAGYLYVSRRHATVGVDDAGQPWIRNENALNDTLVNGRAVPSDRPTPLRDGDEVRLASDVSACVTTRIKASPSH